MSLLLETHVRALSVVNISLAVPLCVSFFFLLFKKKNKQANKTNVNRNTTQVGLQKKGSKE